MHLVGCDDLDVLDQAVADAVARAEIRVVDQLDREFDVGQMIMIRLAILAALSALPGSAAQEEEIRKKAEALLQKLDSDAPSERDAAAEALIAGGDDFEKHIEKAAEGGKPEVRARCQDILKQIELGRKRKDYWSPAKPFALSTRARRP